MIDCRFSVAMTVYKNDNPDYFNIALKSITNQSLQPNEIIIVADGEILHEIIEIINSYIKSYNYIRFIQLEKNVGLGLALQYAINQCTYNLIARMDSDDYSDYFRFEKEINYLKENKAVDLVGSNMGEFYDDYKKIIDYRIVPENDIDIKQYMKIRCPINHISVMFRKESVLMSGNYQHILYNEDYHLWIRMMMNDCCFHNLQEPLVFARVNKDMFKRRGGLLYYKSEKTIQNFLLKNKLISYPKYIFNICVRFVLQVMIPNKVREIIYKKLLRKNISK